MRFFLPLLSLAAAFGAVAAQPEAARFGFVSVTPSTVRFDQVCSFAFPLLCFRCSATALQPITVKYNSSTARTKPVAVDFYIQGTYANGFVLPQYTLAHVEDMQNISYVQFQRTVSSDHPALMGPCC